MPEENLNLSEEREAGEPQNPSEGGRHRERTRGRWKVRSRERTRGQPEGETPGENQNRRRGETPGENQEAVGR